MKELKKKLKCIKVYYQVDFDSSEETDFPLEEIFRFIKRFCIQVNNEEIYTLL